MILQTEKEAKTSKLRSNHPPTLQQKTWVNHKPEYLVLSAVFVLLAVRAHNVLPMTMSTRKKKKQHTISESDAFAVPIKSNTCRHNRFVSWHCVFVCVFSMCFVSLVCSTLICSDCNSVVSVDGSVSLSITHSSDLREPTDSCMAAPPLSVTAQDLAALVNAVNEVSRDATWYTRSNEFVTYCQELSGDASPRGNCTALLNALCTEIPSLTGSSSGRYLHEHFVSNLALLAGTFERVSNRERFIPHDRTMLLPFFVALVPRVLSMYAPDRHAFTTEAEQQQQQPLNLGEASITLLMDMARCVGSDPEEQVRTRMSADMSDRQRQYERVVANASDRAANAIAAATDYDIATIALPPLLPIYDFARVNGDGACMYRAIAMALMTRVTGYSFRISKGFRKPYLSGQANAELREDYTAATVDPRTLAPLSRRQVDENRMDQLEAFAINVVTAWVKFYTYLLACTTIPTNRITYEDGVVFAPPLAAGNVVVFPSARRCLRAEPVPQGSAVLPSLRALVELAPVIVALRDSNDPTRPAPWYQVRTVFGALLSLPWNNPQFAPAPFPPPMRRLWTTDHATGEVRQNNVDISAFALSAYPTTLATQPGAAWNDYVGTMRNFERYGGNVETLVFSSLLGGAFQQGVLPVSYVQTYERLASVVTYPQYADLFTPYIQVGNDTRASEGQALHVLYTSEHYNAALNHIDEDVLRFPVSPAEVLADLDGFFIRPVDGGSAWQIDPTILPAELRTSERAPAPTPNATVVTMARAPTVIAPRLPYVASTGIGARRATAPDVTTASAQPGRLFPGAIGPMREPVTPPRFSPMAPHVAPSNTTLNPRSRPESAVFPNLVINSTTISSNNPFVSRPANPNPFLPRVTHTNPNMDPRFGSPVIDTIAVAKNGVPGNGQNLATSSRAVLYPRVNPMQPRGGPQ